MDKFRAFRELHEAAGAFVIPNPWDVGSARFLEHLGFKALATTSAGFAFSRGLPDGGVGFDEMIAHCGELAAATNLPVSADLEEGRGDSPESAAETIRAAAEAGLAGCSIEDFAGSANGAIYEFSLAVERVAAAAEAARSLDRDFVFTARAENFVRGRPDIDDTIRRLQAFEEAGADVLYAPRLDDIETVRQICAAVGKPVNVLAGPQFTVADLAAAGVRRISVGSKLAASAFRAIERAAREMLDRGSFDFTGEAVPFGDLQSLFESRR